MRIKKYKVRLPEDGSLRPETIMEKAVNYPAMKRLSSPADIAQLLNDVFSLGLEADEYMYLLTLDTKCRLVGVFEVAHGHGAQGLPRLHTLHVLSLLAKAVLQVCGGVSLWF